MQLLKGYVLDIQCNTPYSLDVIIKKVKKVKYDIIGVLHVIYIV